MSPCALDLSVEVAGVHFRNPLVLASGIWGTSAGLLMRAAQAGAGGVTSKSCGSEPSAGHPNPTLLDWGPGLINALGLPNPGVEAELGILREARAQLKRLGVPLIASVFARTIEKFGPVAKMVGQAEPDLIEVNISCPNIAHESGLPFASSMESAVAVTRRVKSATDIPISVKLAPNVPDIGLIAKGVVNAGADAITAVNTMPAMVIDPSSGQAMLANRVGGISGPALKPIALRCVYEIARCVDVPIIGTGGVLTGTDAAEMLMAGATLVGMGSAVHYRGGDAFRVIAQELCAFMSTYRYGSLAAIRRLAHREPAYQLNPSTPPIP